MAAEKTFGAQNRRNRNTKHEKIAKPRSKTNTSRKLHFNINPIVFSKGTRMDDQLDVFLSSYSREAREIALCLRQLVLEVFPNGAEQIDPKTGTITYGLDRKTSKTLVCAIMPHMKHVNLIFSKGAQIPDPTKLLVGTGGQARHVKIRSEAETENPALRLLLKEAQKLSYKE